MQISKARYTAIVEALLTTTALETDHMVQRGPGRDAGRPTRHDKAGPVRGLLLGLAGVVFPALPLVLAPTLLFLALARRG